MNETDDAILEFYLELDEGCNFRISLPPMAVYMNLVEEMGVLDKAPNTISRRMKKLAKMGLLKVSSEKRGYYRFTDKGAAYLTGDLDAKALELPDES